MTEMTGTLTFSSPSEMTNLYCFQVIGERGVRQKTDFNPADLRNRLDEEDFGERAPVSLEDYPTEVLQGALELLESSSQLFAPNPEDGLVKRLWLENALSRRP